MHTITGVCIGYTAAWLCHGPAAVFPSTQAVCGHPAYDTAHALVLSAAQLVRLSPCCPGTTGMTLPMCVLSPGQAAVHSGSLHATASPLTESVPCQLSCLDTSWYVPGVGMSSTSSGQRAALGSQTACSPTVCCRVWVDMSPHLQPQFPSLSVGPVTPLTRPL